MKTANIILPLPLKQTYTYAVPEHIDSLIKTGQRVIVSFGTKRFLTGIVMETGKSNDYPNLKPILEILDTVPLFTSQHIDFWKKMSDYYICPIGDIFKAAVPSYLRLESETSVVLNKDSIKEYLSEREDMILSFLTQHNYIKIAKLQKQFDFKILPILKILFNKGIISFNEEIKNKYKEKTIELVYPTFEIRDKNLLNNKIKVIERAPKQLKLLETIIADCFDDNGAVYIPKAELQKTLSYSPAILKALASKGLITIKKQVISRVLSADQHHDEPATLSHAQKKAVEDIQNVFIKKRTCLLFGITSPDKLSIYTDLILKELSAGKDVLFLVPEIWITSQLLSKLKKLLGSRILEYHSRITPLQQVEVGQELLKEGNKIVIGTRSAIFLPFKNLGLIIVDEEHDNSYCNTDASPRYNAKHATAFLAQTLNSKILLCSATPSISTYAMVESGKIGIVKFENYCEKIKKTDIELINLHEMYHKKRMKGHFSLDLIKAISEVLNKGQQVILFQNRRGYSLTMECSNCGLVPKCIRCDTSLTYHKHINVLKCHYCGYSIQKNINICSSCGLPSVVFSGFGTEQVEEEAKILFPNANIGRLDFDTTKNKESFESILRKFKTQNLNIIVGTQIMAKWLDFSNVTLVAVLNADNLMSFAYYSTCENAFQTLIQISGGPYMKRKSKVIIQTYSPDSDLMQNIINYNYQLFFYKQMQDRNIFRYPPYCRLISITLKHSEYRIVTEASIHLSNKFRDCSLFEVLGPESPPIAKVKNLFLKTILLKIENKHHYYNTNSIISCYIEELHKNKAYKSVKIVLEVE